MKSGPNYHNVQDVKKPTRQSKWAQLENIRSFSASSPDINVG